jgi:hypothetical protein
VVQSQKELIIYIDKSDYVCDVRMNRYKRSVLRLGKRSACYFVIKSTLDSQVSVSEKYYWTNISTTTSNQIVFVTYTWLADVNVSVAKCMCF